MTRALFKALFCTTLCCCSVACIQLPAPTNAKPQAEDMDMDPSSTPDADMVVHGEAEYILADEPFTISVDQERDSSALNARAVDKDGQTVPNVAVQIKPPASDDIFSISSDGKIKGLRPGTSKLVLQSEGLEELEVTVRVIETKALDIPAQLFLDVGQAQPLLTALGLNVAPADESLLTFGLAPEGAKAAELSEDNAQATITGVERGELLLNVTLLHLQAQTRVIVRKPAHSVMLSPPVARLSPKLEGVSDVLQRQAFALLSLDEDGQVRPLADNEAPCQMVSASLNPDRDRWDGNIADLDNTQQSPFVVTPKAGQGGFAQLSVSCTVDQQSVVSNALIEVAPPQALATGGAHSCASVEKTKDQQGQLKCWGYNSHRQLLSPNREFDSTWIESPRNADSSGESWRVDAAEANTCVIAYNGKIYCGGDSRRGVALDAEAPRCIPLKTKDGAPLETSTDLDALCNDVAQGDFFAVDLSVGPGHACAIGDNGRLFCWGQNQYGQLGQGSAEAATGPKEISAPAGGAPWLRVSAGQAHTCAIDVWGQLFCWGENGAGQLGDGTTEARLAPVMVQTPSVNGRHERFVSVAAGISHTCATTTSNAVYCWGQGQRGQLGVTFSDDMQRSASPMLVPITDAVAGAYALNVRSGGDGTCALTKASKKMRGLVCWGPNLKGQLAEAPARQLFPTAADVPPDKDVATFDLGPEHGCLLYRDDEKPHCWGSLGQGRLGLSSSDSIGTSEKDQFLSVFGMSAQLVDIPDDRIPASLLSKDVAFGEEHGCLATVTRGTFPSNIFCWGRNDYGQSGRIPSELTVVTGGRKAVSVGATLNTPANNTVFERVFVGPSHACALAQDGYAYCWGNNSHGQLGEHAKDAQDQPLAYSEKMHQVSAAKFSMLALGEGFTCGVLSDSPRIACWGDHRQGALGNIGGASCFSGDASCAVKLKDSSALEFARVLALSANRGSVCAAVELNDGTSQLYCWGAEVSAAGAAGKAEGAVSMSQLSTSFSLKQLVSSQRHHCALLESVQGGSFEVHCWGDNRYGQAGQALNEPWISSPKRAALTFSEPVSIEEIVTGATSTCLRLKVAAEHYVSCWGENRFVQFGDDELPLRISAAAAGMHLYKLSNQLGINKIFGGGDNLCAIGAAGLRCLGDNSLNQLLRTSNASIVPTPSQVRLF